MSQPNWTAILVMALFCAMFFLPFAVECIRKQRAKPGSQLPPFRNPGALEPIPCCENWRSYGRPHECTGDDELDLHLNPASQLPPVDCPLLISVQGQLLRASRPTFAERKGDDLEYQLTGGGVITGRFPWTYQ